VGIELGLAIDQSFASPLFFGIVWEDRPAGCKRARWPWRMVLGSQSRSAVMEATPPCRNLAALIGFHSFAQVAQDFTRQNLVSGQLSDQSPLSTRSNELP